MDDKRKLNITYLLGAGASAYAVPTIKYFNLFLEDFKHFINKNREMINEVDNVKKIDSYINIIDKISGFATIDTWARKLYLSDSNLYNDLKNLLILFITYCQLGSKDPLPDYFRDGSLMTRLGLMPNDIEKQQLNRMYYAALDPRYDLFLGSILLKPDRSSLVSFPSNINVISWNYDSQFETSLKTFSQTSIIKANGDSCLPIKLNGSANMLVTTHQDANNFKTLFNFSEDGIYNQNNIDNILTILSGGFGRYSSFSSNLTFAWEMGNNTITPANDILLDTEILIVIGYTFPSFNQEVERRIFKDVNKIRKVYYQIPETEYNEGLLDRLKATVFNGKERPQYNIKEGAHFVRTVDVEFVNINDLKQFYIPNEFYLL